MLNRFTPKSSLSSLVNPRNSKSKCPTTYLSKSKRISSNGFLLNRGSIPIRLQSMEVSHQHLLVRYHDDSDQNYVSIADDDTFPQHKVYLTVPRLVKGSHIIGCSHGLLCVYGNSPTVMAVVWNLSIRKAVGVVVPNVPKDGIYTTALGFGVCPETNDPKIVKITQIDRRIIAEYITNIPWQVEVFTLSTGVWRNPYSTNLPRKSIHFCYPQVVIDGLLPIKFTSDRFDNVIISFDMTSEEFTEVNLPDSLAHQNYLNLSMCKLRESSLVVLERDVAEKDFVVWMMEDGVPKSFTKLFSVDVNLPHASVLGFTKRGAPIVENCGVVVVYEPYSEHRD
ncbi:hypothetical protein L1987_46265 [Smallanthus sonchifolius]|uniref:Uncharacterized protein n=1 Tax=Smallanthus sonchifolius TaxID=185202 RepID=A0ACB9G086_9ASTR|nr:hypothetical protein L1987_46265 [Smallanthus sonchifolius]